MTIEIGSGGTFFDDQVSKGPLKLGPSVLGLYPKVVSPLAIAIDYWRFPSNSTLRDVVMVVRADEAHHLNVNHFASDIHYQGLQLREAPALLDYH
ncbi:hypothetical protein PTKIN_Ptkin10aG0046000 [Pterospermum kingtungense]